jgi:hypothetical protein
MSAGASTKPSSELVNLAEMREKALPVVRTFHGADFGMWLLWGECGDPTFLGRSRRAIASASATAPCGPDRAPKPRHDAGPARDGRTGVVPCGDYGT